MGRNKLRKPRQERSDVATILAAARRLLAHQQQDAPVDAAALWSRTRCNCLLQLPEIPLDIDLLSVSGEYCASQPSCFRGGLQLHKFQLPSLGWMMAREKCANCEVSRSHEAESTGSRCGILADSVGFGKTVITLALIDKMRGPMVPCSAPEPLTSYFIPSRATVIITPPNLWEQWNNEIHRFLQPEKFKVIAAADIKVLKQCTIEDLSQADIIVISYKIFESPQYRERLAQFGSGGKGTRNFVRFFFEASQSAQSDTSSLVGQQIESGSSALASLQFPVLEMFYFHRLVADEFHELVCAVGQASHPFYRAMVSLCELHARSRWGLTSTPPLKSVFEVATTSAFFHVDLTTSFRETSSVEALQDDCSKFVLHMFRRSSSPPLESLPELAQGRILVHMTRHERALYAVAAREESSNARARTARLLARSSLHRHVAPSEQDKTTASDLCKEELEERRRPILQLEQDMRYHTSLIACQRDLVHMEVEGHCLCFEDLLSQLHESNTNDSTLLELQHQKLKVQEMVSMRDAVDEVLISRVSKSCRPRNDGHRAALNFLANERSQKNGLMTQRCAYLIQWNLQQFRDAVDTERRHVHRLGELYSPLLLFQSALAKADDGFMCPICHDEFHRDSGCIASCTHIACMSCWTHIFERQEIGQATCPMCRVALSRLDVLPLSGHVGDVLANMASQEMHQLQRKEVERAQTGTAAEVWALRFARVEDLDDLAEYGAYGTKTRCVIETLKSIRSTDENAKILIFVQWEVMKHTLKAAFEYFEIPHINLRGSTYERAALLRQFAERDGPWAMLLSMEFSPSGVNLVAANHVVLVQPTWHENCHEKSVDFEEQSIGRCWRQGQERIVHVWRLCTEDTVEEEFVDEHIRIWNARVRGRCDQSLAEVAL